MRIEGMDANSLTIQKPKDTSSANKNNENNTYTPHQTAIDTKNISHLSEYEKNELPISERVVIDAIEKANKAILGASTKFEFSIHKETKAIMVKIVDSDTHEVIREIPPEKILDMVAKMWEMAGIIVDERR